MAYLALNFDVGDPFSAREARLLNPPLLNQVGPALGMETMSCAGPWAACEPFFRLDRPRAYIALGTLGLLAYGLYKVVK